MDTVLITGATSGIGLAIAQTLLKKDYKILGTTRNPEKHRGKFDFDLLSLDVTSPISIQNFVGALKQKNVVPDVLINNAGIVIVGSAEETPIELARQQFDTNFWGVVNITRACLPAMRKQRKGKIITIGSLGGLIGIPLESYYSASKHALEGFLKSLRFEVRHLNIKVSVIEPGFFKTNLMSNPEYYSKATIEDYEPIRKGAIEVITQSFENARPPQQVADTVLRILSSKDPKFSYRVGKDARVLPVLQFALYRMFEKGAAKHFKI